MSIEQLITENTASIKALTAALADLMQHLSGAADTPINKEPPPPAGVTKAPRETVADSPEPMTPVETTAKQEAPDKPKKEPKGDPVTYDDVKAATLALHKTVGRDAVLEILTKYGVDNATKLDKKQWAAYIADCKKATP